jgi:hypothetical protein
MSRGSRWHYRSCVGPNARPFRARGSRNFVPFLLASSLSTLRIKCSRNAIVQDYILLQKLGFLVLR